MKQNMDRDYMLALTLAVVRVMNGEEQTIFTVARQNKPNRHAIAFIGSR